MKRWVHALLLISRRRRSRRRFARSSSAARRTKHITRSVIFVRLFNWAIGTHEFGIRTSPIAQLKPKDLIGKRETRERTLSDEELRAVWMAAGEMGYPYAQYFGC